MPYSPSYFGRTTPLKTCYTLCYIIQFPTGTSDVSNWTKKRWFVEMLAQMCHSSFIETLGSDSNLCFQPKYPFLIPSCFRVCECVGSLYVCLYITQKKEKVENVTSNKAFEKLANQKGHFIEFIFSFQFCETRTQRKSSSLQQVDQSISLVG